MQSVIPIAKIAMPRTSLWSAVGLLPNLPTLAALKMAKMNPNILKPIAIELSTDTLRVLNILIFGWPSNQILINPTL